MEQKKKTLPEQSSNVRVKVQTWQDVREKVLKVNKELVSIIDKLNPDNRHKLIEVKYFYGDLIVSDGATYLPDEYSKKLHPIDSQEISSEIRKQLNYSTIPLFLLLEKDCEVFLDSENRVIPLNLYNKGSLLGLFETADFMCGYESTSKWSVSAGSRSIVMLPKIADNVNLERIKAFYNIPSNLMAKKPTDHWELFKAIAQSEKAKQSWECSVLMFGKDWFTNESLEWLRFRNYLFKNAWYHGVIAIRKVYASSIWEKCARKLALRNLTPRPYLIDHVKHILSIALGNFPALMPINNSQESVPTNELERAFLEIYLLKKYIPSIFHIDSMDNFNPQSPFYYPLSFPIFLEGTIVDQSSSTIMEDIRSIKLIIETIKNPKNNDGLLSNINFDFYHIEQDKLKEIKSSALIFKEDSRFLNHKKRFPDREFCETSPLLRGLIKINKKH